LPRRGAKGKAGKLPFEEWSGLAVLENILAATA
jgi:hypothetical protein